jgi:two-component system sensor histidine kinase UhpB
MLARETTTANDPVRHCALETTRLVERAATELRRVCRGLRPPVLDDLGLEPAATQLVKEFEERTGLAVHLQTRLGDDAPEVAPETALCIYRVLQESLNNVSRHARASTVQVELTRVDHCVVLKVVDDGRGFVVGDAEHGCGLAGMRERGALVGGRLVIRSQPGAGTEVMLHVPARPDRKR